MSCLNFICIYRVINSDYKMLFRLKTRYERERVGQIPQPNLLAIRAAVPEIVKLLERRVVHSPFCRKIATKIKREDSLFEAEKLNK